MRRLDGLVCARYPLHDLEELLGWPIAAELAEMTGHSAAAVAGWKVRGLSWQQADELACGLDYHPALVWGEDWWEPLVQPGDPRALPPKRVRPMLSGQIGSVGEQIERAIARRREYAKAG